MPSPNCGWRARAGKQVSLAYCGKLSFQNNNAMHLSPQTSRGTRLVLLVIVLLLFGVWLRRAVGCGPPTALVGPSPPTPAGVFALHAALDRVAACTGNGMGHSGNLPEQTRLLFEMVKKELPSPSLGDGLVFCEIGFNVGHSASTFLSAAAARGAKVKSYHIFDLDASPSVRMGYNYLRSAFPATTFAFVVGDSTVSLPVWIGGPDVAVCDLFHIDGGHAGGIPAIDWANVRKVIRKDGRSLVVFDDCGCLPGSEWWCIEPEEVFDAAVASGAMIPVSKGEISLPSKGTCAGRGKTTN